MDLSITYKYIPEYITMFSNGLLADALLNKRT